MTIEEYKELCDSTGAEWIAEGGSNSEGMSVLGLMCVYDEYGFDALADYLLALGIVRVDAPPMPHEVRPKNRTCV